MENGALNLASVPMPSFLLPPPANVETCHALGGALPEEESGSHETRAVLKNNDRETIGKLWKISEVLR